MRYVALLIIMACTVYAAPMKVVEWPRTITLDGKLIANPTPEQCAEAGYALYTPQDLMAQEEARQQKEAARQQLVQGLRAQYVQATLALCALGDLPPVTKFEDAGPIQAIYEGIMAGLVGETDPAVILQILAKASQAQALAQALQMLISELRRFDGDDAWERIPTEAP